MGLVPPSDYSDSPAGAPVAHPPHYTKGKIEVWDFIIDKRLGYLEGNVVKYICRHEHKGNSLQDLQKARAYLEKLIEGMK